MADTQYLIQSTSLEKLSNAVRENTGISEQMTIDEMVEKLNTGVVPVSKGGTGATDAVTARENLEAAASSHTHNEYLPTSGGKMTGDLHIKAGQRIVSAGANVTKPIIRTVETNDVSGLSIAIGAGGYTVIGGGESAEMVMADSSLGFTANERMCIANDGGIDFYTNVQNGLASAKHITMNTDGSITASKFNGAATSLTKKGSNTIGSTSTDTTSNWGEHNSSVHWYSTKNIIKDQPSQYGYLLNIGEGSEVHQVWMTQSSGSLYHRGGSGNGWNGTWREILDKSNFVNIVYPVGAIYLSLSSTSPASLFGGSWTAITGRFLYCNNGTGTGGSNTHKLSVNEIPSHNHRVGCDLDVIYNKAGQSWSVHDAGMSGAGGSVLTSSSGGNAAHNNMPAYQTVYAWRRTG